MRPAPRLCLLVVVLLATGACRERKPGGFFGNPMPPDRGRTLVFGNGAEPEYLDPGLASESSGTEVARNLWEGLTEYHPVTLEPTPAVAERWDISEDGTTYTFHLRKDAKWSNGDPVTSEDFHWSWIRVLTPETISQYANLLYTFVVGAEGFYLRTLLSVKEGGAPLTATSQADSGSSGQLEAGDWAQVLVCDKQTVAARAPDPVPQPVAGATSELEVKSPTDPPHRIKLGNKGAGLDLHAAGEGHVAGTAVTVIEYRDGAVKRPGVESHWVRVADDSGKELGWMLTEFLEQAEGAGRCYVERRDKGFAPEESKTAAAPAPPKPDAFDEQVGVVPAADQALADSPLFDEVVGVVPTADETPAAPAPAAVAKTPPPAGWTDRAKLKIDPAVVGVETPDPHTLVVHLRHPVSFFLELMAWVTFRPAHRASVEKHGQYWTRPENIVTNGAFTLTDWRIQYQLVLEPNPHYWDRDTVKLDKVVALSIDNNHAVMNLYEASEVDYTGPGTSLPTEYQDFLKTKDDFVLVPHLGSYYYWVNVGAKPVDDRRVREALARTIDRKAIVEYVTRAGQLPVSHIVPPGVLGYTSPEGPAFDPEKARQLLADAGYPGGEGLPEITLTFNTSEGHRKVAEAIQQMWKKHLGIHVEITNQEWKVYLKNLQYKFYQVGRMGWIGDYNDPYTFLSLFTSDDGHNYGGYKNPEYDALVAKALREPDLAQRNQLYKQAEAMVLRDLPVLPIYIYTRSWITKPYVRGLYPNVREMHPLKYAWIDEEWEPGKPYGPDPAGVQGFGKWPHSRTF